VDAQIAALNAQEDERRGEVEYSIARERFASKGLAERSKAIAAAAARPPMSAKSRRSGP